MRFVSIIAVVVLVLAAGYFLFSRQDVVTSPSAVAWRLDRDTQSSVLGPQSSAERVVRKLKLGTGTRSAVTPAGTAFEVRMPAGTTEVLFSIGVQAPPRAVRFTIDASATAGWETFYSEEVPAGTEGWSDRSLRFRRPVPKARRLRFETAAADGQGVAKGGYWGSVRILRATAPSPLAAPNVILISLDTLNADHLGSFGNRPDVSPHIDAFLADSASFRRAYSQYPNTLVSHASILTGLYPHHHAMLRQGRKRYEQLPNLATVLGRAGYLTAAFTEDAFVGSGFGFDHGFDSYDDGRKSIAGDAAETFPRAAGWIERYGQNAPFFLFVHTYEVHIPYTPRDAEARRIVDEIDPGYSGPFAYSYGGLLEEGPHNMGTQRLPERDIRHLPALYSGEINYLDRVVDEFLRQISQLPSARRTLIVLTADHGEEFDEHGKLGHGETLYNHALHVPLAFHWPGHVRAAASDAVVELVDIMPTVLDLAGVPPPAGVDGTDLAPAITRGATLPPRPAFAELVSARGECAELKLPEDCDLGRAAVQTARFKLITSQKPPFAHLYDLQKDPGETRDVAADFPQEVAQYRAMLQAYMSGRPAIPPQQPTPEIDQETRERLRALGY